MFVRMQEKKGRLAFALLESVRVEGKTSQKTIATIGSINRSQIKSPFCQYAFWLVAMSKLRGAGLSKDDLIKATQALKKHVPRQTTPPASPDDLEAIFGEEVGELARRHRHVKKFQDMEANTRFKTEKDQYVEQVSTLEARCAELLDEVHVLRGRYMAMEADADGASSRAIKLKKHVDDLAKENTKLEKIIEKHKVQVEALKKDNHNLKESINTLKRTIASLQRSSGQHADTRGFSADFLKQLIVLCHPDKHSNSEQANKITAKLNELRDAAKSRA